MPIQKTMDVLNDLKAQGKIKAIGAANVDINQIEEYLKWGQLDIVQAKYSILDLRNREKILFLAAVRMVLQSRLTHHLRWVFFLEHSQEITNR